MTTIALLLPFTGLGDMILPAPDVGTPLGVEHGAINERLGSIEDCFSVKGVVCARWSVGM